MTSLPVRRSKRGGVWAAVLAASFVAAGFVAGLPAVRAVGPAVSPTVDYVNITATSSLSFAPASFTVYPGASVHLTVLQAANFLHTFTLSPVRNATIPSSDTTSELDAYLHAHTPTVNLSLGSTGGKSFHANFTAPSVGTYEFLCIIHFPGMVGTMTSSKSGPATAGTTPISATDLEIVGGALVVVVAVVAVALYLRRRKREEADRSSSRRSGRSSRR
ncbi:MAG TPA: hypothetical protein VEH10_04470 [Thermoplasmata archaeon]|nr:hypothetical protein [Thermoplasmata archaeon]